MNRIKPLWWSCTLLTSVFLSSNLVSADDLESAQRLSDLSLEQLLAVKVRVATKTEKSLNQVPASVNVFTQQQIQRLGIETLEELLVFVPGIQVFRGETGGGSFTFSPRGRRADEGNNRDILLLIDGSRINEPVTTGAFEQERQISLHNVKKVEVIRGPGSALYGSNAFLAVINIETDKKSKQLLLAGGAFSQRRAELSHYFEGDDWRLSLSASHYQDKGEDYPAFYEFWGKLEDTQDPTERNNLTLSAEYENLSFSYRFSNRRYDDFLTLGAQLNGLQRQKMQSEILRASYQFDWQDHQLNIFAERQEGIFDYLTGLFPYDPQPSPTQSGLYWTDGSIDAFVGGNYREVTQNRVGLVGNWSFSKDHQIAYGLSARQEKSSLNPFQGNYDAALLESTGELVPTTADNFIQRGFWIGGERFDLLQPEARSILGVYLQDEWQINEKFSATLGVRLDDYEDFGSNSSFRGGLVFDEGDHYWKLLYGEAFRAPSFTETRAGIASGGISNPDLKPEFVKTTELIGGLNRENWRMVATLYNNSYSDMVVSVLVDDVVVGLTAVQPQNIGEESSSGIEFEFNWQLSENWQLNLGGDYLIDPLKAQKVAKERLFARLDYQKENYSLNIQTHYLGEVLARQSDGADILVDQYLDSYWITNLNTRWKLTERSTLFFKATNLFDESFYSYSPQLGLETGLPGRGRSFQLGVSYSY